MPKKEKIFIFFQKIISVLFLISFPRNLFASTTPVNTLIENLANFLKNLVASIGVIVIILAGYYIITAEGDPGKLEKGRQALLWGVIGIGIAVLAGEIKTQLCSSIGC